MNKFKMFGAISFFLILTATIEFFKFGDKMTILFGINSKVAIMILLLLAMLWSLAAVIYDTLGELFKPLIMLTTLAGITVFMLLV